jgi:hypothetical protein
MKMPSNRIVTLNAVAGGVVVLAMIVFVRDTLSPKTVEACSLRYHQAQTMSLRNGTKLLSPEELQSSLNGLDRGVSENLSLASLKEGPAPVAMAISYSAGSSFAPNSASAKGGVSFPWQPSGLPSSTQSACLTYHVYAANDFDFGQGGVLPGMAARDMNSTASTPDALETRIVWRAAGRLQTSILRTADGKVDGDQIDGNSVQITKGRWVKIDHEVVLNTPTAANGVVRTWVDGTLAVERTDIRLRNSANVSQAGVFAVTHFGGEGIGGGAKKDEKLYFTPFELRWNKPTPSAGS